MTVSENRVNDPLLAEVLRPPANPAMRQFRGMEKIEVCGYRFDVPVVVFKLRPNDPTLECRAHGHTGVRQKGTLVGLDVEAHSAIGIAWLLTRIEAGIRACLRELNDEPGYVEKTASDGTKVSVHIV